MRIHTLICGCMRPFGGALWDGVTPGLGAARLTCRCLLIESEAGLVLVDTGFGMGDVFDAANRLDPVFRNADRVVVKPGDTAHGQIGALGLDPKDVRHIVMTHLDFDHAGGLSDFPWATVHVLAPEAHAARRRDGAIARARYRPEQLHTVMREYDRTSGARWYGMPAVRDLQGLPEGIVMVPLPGHTAGHCGVAVRTTQGWLLHAGDAIFNLRELREKPRCPPLAQGYEVLMQVSSRARNQSQAALRALMRHHADEVQVICTHDPVADPMPLPAVRGTLADA
ncbi:MBL fold metallo-hydrolase [Roseomonas elaeocarpi]|uniref:MBL fold metallo-hydrolase n=1 Tax=Roseomonas elaeocarpi TaxID=907779 RepID=A0ABV6K253_9PROT